MPPGDRGYLLDVDGVLHVGVEDLVPDRRNFYSELVPHTDADYDYYFRQSGREFLRAADADGDGGVTRDELVAAVRPYAGDDGRLDEAERRKVLVDGKLVDRPSFRVKPGQMIHVKAKSEKTEPFQVAAAGGHVDVLPKVPGYLEVEIDKLQARLVRRPKRVEVSVTCEVQLVVEYYAAR